MTIKGLMNSVALKYSICNKSWLQIDDSGERTTFVFKPNHQLHLTINGISIIVPWKYFPENERLVIYYKQIEGVSYRYSFYETGVLLTLKADQTGTILILANEAAENAPKSVEELGQYFKKKNAALVSSVICGKVSSPVYYERVAQTLDKVLDGCDNEILVEHISYFRKNVPGFEDYFRGYINYKKFLIDYPPKHEDDSLSILRNLDNTSRTHRIIPPVSLCDSLEKYIVVVGERIDYDKTTKRAMEIIKMTEGFKEQWG